MLQRTPPREVRTAPPTLSVRGTHHARHRPRWHRPLSVAVAAITVLIGLLLLISIHYPNLFQLSFPDENQEPTPVSGWRGLTKNLLEAPNRPSDGDAAVDTPIEESPAPTPTPDPRTIQSGMCTGEIDGMPFTLAIAGYNQMRIDVIDQGITYTTLYTGRAVYYWTSDSPTGLQLFYLDAIRFDQEGTTPARNFMTLRTIRSAANPDCTTTQDVSLGLFSAPENIEFNPPSP